MFFGERSLTEGSLTHVPPDGPGLPGNGGRNCATQPLTRAARVAVAEPWMNSARVICHSVSSLAALGLLPYRLIGRESITAHGGNACYGGRGDTGRESVDDIDAMLSYARLARRAPPPGSAVAQLCQQPGLQQGVKVEVRNAAKAPGG